MILKECWKDSSEFIDFAVLAGSFISFYKRYSLTPFFFTVTVEENCQERHTFNQSSWHCGGFYGSQVR